MCTTEQKRHIRRVAIVEDDAGLRLQLEEILKSAERATCVGSFRSAEEALERIREARPDVVLMDIRLPGMSGIECVSRLRKEFPQAISDYSRALKLAPQDSSIYALRASAHRANGDEDKAREDEQALRGSQP